MSGTGSLASRVREELKRRLGPEARRRLGASSQLRKLDDRLLGGPNPTRGDSTKPRPVRLPEPVEWPFAEPAIVEPSDGLPVNLIGGRPSYRYKLEESRRRRAMAREVLGIRDPIMVINDKLLGYGFADRNGIDRPHLYGVYRSIAEVDWGRLPNEFVLKSRFGSSNRGVKALRRRSAAEFDDLLRGRTWRIDEILADQARLEEEGNASRSMFAEELVWKVGNGQTIADDWKFYCFMGRVGLSMQRDLRGSPDPAQWRFSFRDRSWRDLGPVKFADRHGPELTLPTDPMGLVAVAERLSRLVGRPFVRIDLFESARGPLLGEFTPAPGPPEVFDPTIDRMLGEFWEQAEAMWFAQEVEAGVWDHLQVAPSDVVVDRAER